MNSYEFVAYNYNYIAMFFSGMSETFFPKCWLSKRRLCCSFEAWEVQRGPGEPSREAPLGKNGRKSFVFLVEIAVYTKFLLQFYSFGYIILSKRIIYGYIYGGSSKWSRLRSSLSFRRVSG